MQHEVKDYEASWYYYIKVEDDGASVIKYVRRKQPLAPNFMWAVGVFIGL